MFLKSQFNLRNNKQLLSRAMKLVIVLILFLECLVSVSSFTFSSRWVAKPQITTRIRLFPDTFQRQLDEVCIGDLPPTFDALQLKELLKRRRVSGYVNISVLSYETSDGNQYASIRFDTNSLASSAVRTLARMGTVDKLADVSLMPNVSSIYVKVLNPSSIRRLGIPLNENIVNMRDERMDNKLIGVYIYCKSPPHAARLLRQLSSFDWKDKHVTVRLTNINVMDKVGADQNRAATFHLLLSNIDPDEPMENIETLCNEAVGSTNAVSFIRMNIFHATGERLPSCKVYFSKKDACALCAQTLNGHTWKGKVLVCSIEKPLERYVVQVDNVPISWSVEETNKIIQKQLRDIPVKRIRWKEENVNKFGERFVFVELFSAEQARMGSERLNTNVGGVELDARVSIKSYNPITRTYH